MGVAASCWLLLLAWVWCVHAHQEMVTTNGFDDAQRQAIVDKHNEYRRMEEATGMMRLEYDLTLEQFAQRAAETCNFAHTHVTPPELYAKFHGEVGENIFVTSEDSFPDVKPVNDWWEEINHYNFRKNVCAPNKQCGHYKQVIWDSTQYVGCGAAYCGNASGGIMGWEDEHTALQPHTGFIVFCQYAPIGNWPGVRPYTRGVPCSGCPASASHCGDRLCSSHKHKHRIRPTDCLHADKQIIIIEGMPTRCDKFLDKFGDGQCSRDVIREQCCETCSLRRNHGNPGCPHGDKMAWCQYYVPRLHDYICNNTEWAQLCCDSCNYIIDPETQEHLHDHYDHEGHHLKDDHHSEDYIDPATQQHLHDHDYSRHDLVDRHDLVGGAPRLHDDISPPLWIPDNTANMQSDPVTDFANTVALSEATSQPKALSRQPEVAAQAEVAAQPEVAARPEGAAQPEAPDEEPVEKTKTTTTVKDGVTTKVTETVIPLEHGGEKTITRTEVIQPNGSISISTRVSTRIVTRA